MCISVNEYGDSVVADHITNMSTTKKKNPALRPGFFTIEDRNKLCRGGLVLNLGFELFIRINLIGSFAAARAFLQIGFD
jgi:hypothetical protein